MQNLTLKSKVKFLEKRYQKSLAKYLDPIERQKDLTYIEFVLVSSGVNENFDAFPKQRLAEVFETSKYKPIDIAHLLNEKESYIGDELDIRFNRIPLNKNTNTIVGTIIEAILVNDEGEILSPDQIEEIKKQEGFDQDDPIHIVCLAALYDFIFPKTVAALKKLVDQDKMFISVETFFSDWDYLLVEKNEVIKRDASTQFLDHKIGQEYKGSTVARILNDFIIGGAGFTQHPANPSSIILSLNSEDTNFAKQLKEFLELHDQLHLVYANNPLKEIEASHAFVTRKIKELVTQNV